MATELRGRVLSTSSDGRSLTLWAGGRRRLVTLAAATPLSDGALVRLSVGDDGVARHVETLGTPAGGWDPRGDGARWSQMAGESGSRLDMLWRRQSVVRSLRELLFEDGFLEVESPLVVPGACPDAVLDSLETADGYLVTSTEYQLKRLLVGGVERLFSLTKNFRAGDRGTLHSVEFTMLEWARAWEPIESIEDDAERMVRRAYRALEPVAQGRSVHGRNVAIDGARWDRVTLRDALEQHLGVRVDDSFSLGSMLDGIDSARLQLPPSFRDEALLVISYLLDALQPHLGHPVPTFLRAWPAFLTSSAEHDAGNPAIAVRSELYIDGIEVADGFPFLRDAAAQRRSFASQNQRRVSMGKAPVRTDERYVAALEQGIPPGAGMALGVDRLVMVLTGAREIGETQPFAEGEL